MISRLTDPVTRSIASWAHSSQRQARRNAMIASTILAERRRERLEVSEYLDVALGRDPQPPVLPAQRESS